MMGRLRKFWPEPLPESYPVVLAYGGGVNSVGILAGMKEGRMDFPDRIIFADTGGERTDTYSHIAYMDDWLRKQGLPGIEVAKRVNFKGQIMTLEQLSLDNNMLPSLAYGFKSCSHKFKIQPQDKLINNWDVARKLWKSGGKIVKLIGYDLDEEHRWRRAIKQDKKYEYRFPLVEWGWGRDECIEAIQKVGIPIPGKSACFFCPATKKKEILDLRSREPELLKRAIIMEKNAEQNLKTVKGLGRSFNWGEFLQGTAGPDTHIEIDCGCYDG